MRRVLHSSRRYPQPHARHGASARPGVDYRTTGEEAHDALPVLPQHRHPGPRLAGSPRTAPRSAAGAAARAARSGSRTVELMQLTVLKRSGATEPFTRDKAIAGVRKACKGRPVSEDDLACLGQTVEDALRSEGCGRGPGPRGRAGDPRPAARARRGRLPAVRQRLPGVRVRRRLRGRDRPAPRREPPRRRAASSVRRSREPHADRADPQTARRVVGKRARRAHHRRQSTADHQQQDRQTSASTTEGRRGDSMTETVSGDRRSSGRKARQGLKIERVFSTAGVHPYDELTWERRDVVQTELEDRRDRLRAARRGVPRLLVGQRLARSSPRSTSAAPSAPTPASGASSSSSTGS